MLPHTVNALVAGIDEAGRGALAGPVVAGACVLLQPLRRNSSKRLRWSPLDTDCMIADSKQLRPEQREASYEWIVQQCAWGAGIVDAAFVDAHGIVAATERAMQLAVAHLSRSLAPHRLLVDGNDAFHFAYPHSSVIRGDQTEPCIAAASIIAKVTRDRIMTEQCDKHPVYGFSGHKGYGSVQHIDAIKKHGTCVLHRMSFLGNIIPRPPLSSPTTTTAPRTGTPATSAIDRA